MKISKTTEKRFSTPRCISYLLFSLLVFSVHNIPVDAQTDFEECGVFEMDPLGQCLLFYPEDASLGALIVDMGATAPPAKAAGQAAPRGRRLCRSAQDHGGGGTT